jgi:hypothetical protein
VAALILFWSVASLAADEPSNAWGVYAAPTTIRFATGTDYDLGASGSALEMGLYYTRFIGERFSLRLETRFASRSLDAAVPDSTTGYLPVRQEEQILEIPLIAQSERRVPYGDHEMRVSLGAGIVCDFVLEQRLVTPLGQPSALTAGEYMKLGWLLDGAVTFEVDERSGVFGRFRYQRDETTFGESEGASAVSELECFGFLGGLEFRF